MCRVAHGIELFYDRRRAKLTSMWRTLVAVTVCVASCGRTDLSGTYVVTAYETGNCGASTTVTTTNNVVGVGSTFTIGRGSSGFVANPCPFSPGGGPWACGTELDLPDWNGNAWEATAGAAVVIQNPPESFCMLQFDLTTATLQGGQLAIEDRQYWYGPPSAECTNAAALERGTTALDTMTCRTDGIVVAKRQ